MLNPKFPRRWQVILGILFCAAMGFWVFHSSSTSSWDSLKKECRQLLNSQSWQELAIASERWSKAYPNRADPWLYRAEAAEALKDLAAEADFLDRVPATDPRAVSALIRKNRLESEPLNRPWDAQKTCDRILQLDPRVLIAHQQSITFCMLTLQRKEMVHRIREAIHVQRDFPALYLYLFGASWYVSDVTYEMNSHWLSIDPDNETFQVARAMQVYRSDAKRLPGKAAEFAHIPEPEELLLKFPHNLELLAFFLDLKMTAGDLDEVEKILAATPQPASNNDARFCRGRAWIYDAQSDFDKAEKALREGIAIDPYWRHLHYDLSQILRRTGRIEDAERSLKIHDMSRYLMSVVDDSKDPNNPKFQQEMLKLAVMVEDFEVAKSLRARVRAR